MGNSPAFLFYPADWIEGTLLLNRLEKACYLDLLLTQNAHGHLTLNNIQHVLGSDFPIWERLKDKFEVDDRGLFYNDKLERVRQERDNFVKSRIKNLHMGVHMGVHMAPHGGDGDGDGDGDRSKEIEDPRFLTFWTLYPARRGKKIGKAEARIAFSGLKAKEKDDILIAVKNYAAADILAKDPVRFIRKDYWKEWLEPETKSDPYANIRKL